MRIVQAFSVPVSLCFLEGQPAFWKQHGFDLFILSSKGLRLDEFGKKNKVAVVSIAFKRNIWSFYSDLKSLWQLHLFFRKHKIDVVHANTPKAALLTLLVARLHGVPVCIYEMHGLPLETASFLTSPLFRLIEKLTCQLAHHVIAVSESLRHKVLKENLTNPSKISVIRHGSCNGIDCMNSFNPTCISKTDLQSLRQKYQLEEDQQVVGFVGRFSQEKGIVELYHAWQMVKKQFPNAVLLMIGSEDERGKLSKKILQKITQDSNIRLVPWQNDIAPFYALIDFLVLPSYREGFGNVVLEAAAMAKPSVVSFVTGLKSAVIHHQTGLFCKSRSVEELAQRLLFYLENPQVAISHGQNARLRVSNDFVPTDIWEAKRDLYASLAAQNEAVTLPYVSPPLQTAH
ncbi:MAG: glycosyltransferase family 4 protein [Runella sp.]